MELERKASSGQVPGELLEQHYQANCMRNQSLKNCLHENSSRYHHPANRELPFLDTTYHFFPLILVTNSIGRLK